MLAAILDVFHWLEMISSPSISIVVTTKQFSSGQVVKGYIILIGSGIWGATVSLLLNTYDAGPGAQDFKNAFQIISFGISLKVHVKVTGQKA